MNNAFGAQILLPPYAPAPSVPIGFNRYARNAAPFIANKKRREGAQQIAHMHNINTLKPLSAAERCARENL